MPKLSELRAIVRQDVTLDSTDVITDANLDLLLLEGALQFAKDGQPFIVTATWAAVASAQEYILSGGSSPKVTGFLDIYWPTGGLTYTDADSVVKVPPSDFNHVSEEWLNRELPGWKATSASDTLIYTYLGFDSSGFLIFGVYPKSKSTTPSFKLWFISRGTDMSADGNYPYTNDTNEMPHIAPYTKAIAYWAMYVLHRDKLKVDSESNRYLGLYSDLAQKCSDSQEKIAKAMSAGLIQQGKLQATQTFGSL